MKRPLAMLSLGLLLGGCAFLGSDDDLVRFREPGAAPGEGIRLTCTVPDPAFDCAAVATVIARAWPGVSPDTEIYSIWIDRTDHAFVCASADAGRNGDIVPCLDVSMDGGQVHIDAVSGPPGAGGPASTDGAVPPRVGTSPG